MAIDGLSRQQEGTLATVCEIGADRLRSMASEIAAMGMTVDRAKIERLISKHLGSENGEPIARFLFGLAIGSRQDPAAPGEMLERLSERISAVDDPRFSTWAACRDVLKSLLSSHSIRLSAKALEVSYDFERVYRDGRFITSIRPIFDDEREAVLGATVVQTLRVDYSSSLTGEGTTISLVMDMADIVQLRLACDGAIRKGEAAYKAATATWNLPTLMPGEDRS